MAGVLSVKGLVAGYGDSEILHGVDLEVRANELVCVIGPNGAGKSTLLKAILGLARVRGGSILLEGEEVAGLAPNRIVAKGVAYVPQVANVFATLTVRENLEVGAFLRPDLIASSLDRVHELFPLLKERAGERVSRLSGGQRQMVALGRALMPDPKVLLLDEPTAGLAPMVQDEVLGQARRTADAGIPVLLVEQNAKKALALSDRGYVFDQGRNRYEGPGKELLADERIGHLYLGRKTATP
jgi:branched-chain amino acid transport system ATP-binding protein